MTVRTIGSIVVALVLGGAALLTYRALDEAQQARQDASFYEQQMAALTDSVRTLHRWKDEEVLRELAALLSTPVRGDVGPDSVEADRSAEVEFEVDPDTLRGEIARETEGGADQLPYYFKLEQTGRWATVHGDLVVHSPNLLEYDLEIIPNPFRVEMHWTSQTGLYGPHPEVRVNVPGRVLHIGAEHRHESGARTGDRPFAALAGLGVQLQPDLSVRPVLELGLAYEYRLLEIRAVARMASDGDGALTTTVGVRY